MRIAALVALLASVSSPAQARDLLSIDRVEAISHLTCCRLGYLDVSTVRLFVNWLDENGRPVVGRKRDDFTVFIDSEDRGSILASATTFDALRPAENIHIAFVIQNSAAI